MEEGSQIYKTKVIAPAGIEPMYSSEEVERTTSLSRHNRIALTVEFDHSLKSNWTSSSESSVLHPFLSACKIM